MIARRQADSNRIVSLDQFRGYTVAGMLLVNFIGGFREVGAIWKHHNTYCSYADTIMPQFFFAVGFAFRLTFLRRLKTWGVWPATAAAVQRALGLSLLGFAHYHLDGEVRAWDEHGARIGVRRHSALEAAPERRGMGLVLLKEDETDKLASPTESQALGPAHQSS
jgi:predicted acyltransferase